MALADKEKAVEKESAGVAESAFEPSESKSDESDDEATKNDAEENKGEADDDEEQAEDAAKTEETKEFTCNLKFKRVGCYADKSKKNKPLKSFIMSDQDLYSTAKKGKLPEGETFNTELPKFACKCANEAINAGNGIFGIQNVAECWTGPDSSKYDKDGASEDCVTFDYLPCAASDKVCAGKKHANFVYYIDAPEHTKSADEVQKELAAAAAKVKKAKQQKMNESGKKKKSSKKSKKKSKKSKN